MLTPEQLKQLGGSDLAAVLGMSPWKRPIDVWSRVVEGAVTEETPAMLRGTLLEPYIREFYQRETHAKLLGPTAAGFPGKPFLRASLDDRADFDGELRVAEFKSSTWRRASEWDGDEVPVDFNLQCQWYMRATGDRLADLAVLFGVDDFRIKTIAADAELQDMCMDAMCRFWIDHVKTGKPPPPDASDSYKDFLAKRFPKNQGAMLEATPEVDVLVALYQEAERRFGGASDELDTIKNSLKALIGTAEGIIGRWGKLTWRAAKDSSRTDWKALAEELRPSKELVAKHTTTTPGSRRLLTTWSK